MMFGKQTSSNSYLRKEWTNYRDAVIALYESQKGCEVKAERQLHNVAGSELPVQIHSADAPRFTQDLDCAGGLRPTAQKLLTGPVFFFFMC